ncbi:MAG: hypothetical protein ACKVS6_15695 [Planctomycetota bacterium]
MPGFRHQSAILRSLARVGFAGLATFVVLGSIRSTAAGFGGGASAIVMAVAAAAISYAIGTAFAGRFCKFAGRLPFAAALLISVLIVAPPAAESVLCAGAAAADGPAGTIILLLLSLPFVFIPAAALGAFLKHRPFNRFAETCAGAAIALFIIDGPWIPERAIQIFTLAAPFLIWILTKRTAAAHASAPIVRVEPGRRQCLARPLAVFFFGAGIAVAIVSLRIELRSFVRGSLWDISRMDIVALSLASIGAAVSGAVILKTRRGFISIASGLAAAGVAFALLRLSTLTNADTFRHVKGGLERFAGAAAEVDGSLYVYLLVAALVPFPFVIFGAASRGIFINPRSVVPAMAGFAAGLLFVTIRIDYDWSDAMHLPLANADSQVAAVARSVLFIFCAAGAAGFAAARKRRIVAFVGFAAAALSCYLLPSVDFRISNVFSSTRRLVIENHKISEVRESIAGIATKVESPDWSDDEYSTRTTRTRVDRTARTPAFDELQTYHHALVRSVLLHGSPEKILVLGPRVETAQRIIEQNFRLRVEFNSLPSIANFRAGSDTPAASARGYDLIIFPPQPCDVADVSLTLNATHLFQVEHALNENGVIAWFLDASTTPPNVIERLKTEWLDSYQNSAAIFVSDGVRAPAIGLIARIGGEKLIPENSKFKMSAPDPAIPSLPFENDMLGCDLRGNAHRNISYSILRFLPPVAVSRSYSSFTSLDLYDTGPRRNRYSAVNHINSWSQSEDGALGATLALASACAAFDSQDWNLSNFRAPILERPVPQGAMDGIVKSLRILPANAPAKRAFVQIARTLMLQDQLSNLWKFSDAARAADTKSWEPVYYYSVAVRKLNDPQSAETALAASDKFNDPDATIAFVCERAEVALALGKGDAAISLLQRGLTEHSTSREIARTLATSLASLGRYDEAVTAATHYQTLSRNDPSAGVFVESLRRQSEKKLNETKPESQPKKH